MKEGNSFNATDNRLIEILEKQKQDLVVRVLRKHEEVEAGREFTNKVLASLSDLFFLLTDSFQLAQANQGFYHTLGYGLENKSLTLADLVGETECTSIRLALEKGELKGLETHLIDHTGTQIPVNLKGSTYTTDSGNTLHMLIATDMSDFYAMMSRMHEAQEQLIHSARLASLGEMAAGIGHELTQPLNAILLFSRNCLKVLHDPMKDQTMLEENLNIIIDRVNKAASIIRSLKGFGGKTTDETTSVNINAILSNILNFLDSQLTLSEVEVELHLDSRLPHILGQEVKLEQVFLNLMQNAIQAMGRTEHPKMTIKTFLQSHIEPETLQEKEFIVVMIQDNGEGISPDIQRKIFDPFFTTREVGTGMGLGLSIVDRIIRELSGFIKIESPAGKGASFLICLPPCPNQGTGAR
ncbi:MAG: PAS domain-containing protein [Desulfoarculaceae bacterium]|nr:PAS domain-containing protein [Desulfoarculaceae bacterium]